MTAAISKARAYLRSIGREGVLDETAARPYKLAAVQDDIAALHEAGYSPARIYQWLLEHRPEDSDSFRCSKDAKNDINRIYVHIKRLDAGVVGAKRGRPAKNPAAKVAKVSTEPVNTTPDPITLAAQTPTDTKKGAPTESSTPAHTNHQKWLARNAEVEASRTKKTRPVAATAVITIKTDFNVAKPLEELFTRKQGLDLT